MTKITTEDFIQAMRDAVAERGADYVYPPFENFADDYHNEFGACQYQTPDGTPACIVGLALSKIDPNLVPEYGEDPGAERFLTGKGLDPSVAEAAGWAQGIQDDGKTWGEALKEFERVIAK